MQAVLLLLTVLLLADAWCLQWVCAGYRPLLFVLLLVHA